MRFIFADEDGTIVNPTLTFTSLTELRDHLIAMVGMDEEDMETGDFYEISGRYQYESPKKKYSFKKLKD